jgi:hypothetical protein
MMARLLLGGLKSYLPTSPTRIGHGPQEAARYSYSVWMRHLTLSRQFTGMPAPRSVVELGPGPTLGAGLAALLSGADRYVALDTVRHADTANLPELFDELRTLFADRTDIPGPSDFPRLHPRLDSYSFPEQALAADRLERAHEQDRLEAISRDIAGLACSDSTERIRYICPRRDSVVPPGSADFVFSQAVLQEIDHGPSADTLAATFRSMARWLARGGVISHQIDLSAYGLRPWNAHWTIGDTNWKLARGRRRHWVNRVPLSGYLALCDAHGFDIAGLVPAPATTSVRRTELSRRFTQISDQDLTTCSVYLAAVKR